MLADATWTAMFNMPQIAIVVGGLIAIAVVVGVAWYNIERVKSNNELKRSLAERGMSIEDIERIMSSGEAEDE